MKIKIIVCAVLALSLSFAFSSNAARGSNAALQPTEESNDSAAESKTFAAAQTDAAAIKFKGSIGEAVFEMTLRRAGDDLSGSYFYAKSGSANRLALRGQIDASGKFALRETDAGGKETGEFTGVWQDEADESVVTIEGEWRGTGADKGLKFFAEEQVIAFSGGARFANKKFSSPVKAIRLDASAEYPQLIGGAAGAASFNRTVRARAEKSINDFRRLMIKATTREDLKRLPKDVGYYIDLGCSVQYADDNLVSLLFSEDTYSGGAHPNHNFFALNYDLKNGRELKLADVFKTGAKYLKTVSAYSTKDLQSRKSLETGANSGLAQDIWLEGVKPTAENYRTWNVTRKGLMFTFDPYQVGAYVDGPQFVIVPFANLKIVAKPDGALTKFVK